MVCCQLMFWDEDLEDLDINSGWGWIDSTAAIFLFVCVLKPISPSGELHIYVARYNKTYCPLTTRASFNVINYI
jgi:hypothetical protein